MATSDDPGPPPVVAELRRSIDEVCADYEGLVTVKHDFDAAEHYVPDSDDWPADHGWTTQLLPAVQGIPVQVYFDGVDQDLEVRVGEYPRWVGWFEWSTDELVDIRRVASDVAGLLAGVLVGDVWEWRTDRERGCEVLTPTGRLWRATDGRPPANAPLWRRRRSQPESRRRLPGYRPGQPRP